MITARKKHERISSIERTSPSPRRLAACVGACVFAVLLLPTVAVGNGPPITFTDNISGEPPDPHPCTGRAVTITATLTFRVHEFESSAGQTKLMMRFSGPIEDTEGFSGRIGETVVQNGSLDGDFTLTDVYNAVLSDDAGRRMRAHGTIHVTRTNGEIVVDNFLEDIECLGKPS